MYKLSSNKSYGGKIDSTLIMRSNGFNVPESFVIPYELFIKVLKNNNVLEEFKALTDFSSEVILYRFKKIKKLIDSLTFDNDLNHITSKKLFEMKLPLIVRSSCSDEDSLDTSMAGLYESIKVSNYIELQEAIKKCWGSAYTNQVYTVSQKFPSEINLLIQNFEEVDKSGVAFSHDSINGDFETIRIEAVFGGCENLVNGVSEPELILVDKKLMDIKNESTVLSETNLKLLHKTIVDLEKLFKTPVDVEWGFLSNHLIIFQCRPITNLNNKKRKTIGKWYSLDDVNSLSNVCLGNSQNNYEHFLNKKYWSRLTLTKSNKRLAVMGIFFYTNKTLTKDQINLFLNYYSGEIIEFRIEKKSYFVRRNVLEVFNLLKLLAVNDIRTSVLVVECIPNLKCGYASVTSDGNIYIEMVNGGFNGIWKGTMEVSKYLVAPDLNIIEEIVASNFKKYEFNKLTLSWEEKKLDELEVSQLSNKEIKEIVDLTLILENSIGGVSNEWISNEDGVFFFDLSQELISTDKIDKSYNIVSRGNFEGLVKKVDSYTLDDWFETIHEVNVVRTEEFSNKVDDNEKIDQIKSIIGDGKPIIVTDFPNRTLTPLVPYVSGFIFKKAASLCHLSIILRELNIPAIIYPQIEELTDGTQVSVINGEILK